MVFEGFDKRGRLRYTIEKPIDPLQFTENHLIVVFPGAVGAVGALDVDVQSRMFGKSKFAPLSILSKNIGKNTYILRIADTNLISGSYFCNTVTYPDYEADVQALILTIRDKLGIKKENTLLWGESR